MHTISLIKLAYRDTKGSRKKLLLFALSFVTGIATLIAAIQLQTSVSSIIQAEAKALLGADLSVASKYQLESSLLEQGKYLAAAREVRFRAMARLAQATKLVQVRALENNLPFYGEVTTEPNGLWRNIFQDKDVALIDQTLALQTQSKVGELLEIGTKKFLIVAIVTAIPGTANVSSAVAPRIYINYQAAAETTLLQRGSVADYYWHYKISAAELENQEKALRNVSDQQINIETVNDKVKQIGAISDNITFVIWISGLLILCLGAVGVGGALFFYLKSKINEAALLKCLGVTSWQVVTLYFIQIAVVAAFSALLGAILGQVVSEYLAVIVNQIFKIQLVFNFSVKYQIIAVALSFLSVVLCALPGIILIRYTPAYAILRSNQQKFSILHKLFVIIVTLVCLFAILLVSGFALIKAIMATLGIVGALFLLLFISNIVINLAKYLARHIKYFPVRFGFLNLSRPNNNSLPVIIAFSLTVSCATLILIVQGLLQNKVDSVKAENAANIFIYDLQPDQLQDLKSLLAAINVPVVEEVPIVLMRITEVAGKPVQQILADSKSKIPAWTLKRDYWSSYRSEIAENEKVIAGQWYREVPANSKLIPISVEDRLLEKLSIGLGDRVVFDLQGQKIETFVANIRTIYWEQMRRNAFIIFPQGVLENAPKFLFLTAIARDPKLSAELHSRIAQSFPGVSVIDLATAVDSVANYLSQIAKAVKFLAIIIFVNSIVVFLITMVSSKAHKRQDLEILRALGLPSRARKISIVSEYFLLTLIALLLGLTSAFIAGYCLNLSVFKTSWSINWQLLLILIAGFNMVFTLVGFLSVNRK